MSLHIQYEARDPRDEERMCTMPLCPRSYFVAWAASRAIVIPDTLVDRVRMYAVCIVCVGRVGVWALHSSWVTWV